MSRKLLPLLLLLGCGNAEGPDSQVGVYGVNYPRNATPQEKQWLNETVISVTLQTCRNMGVGAHCPKAGDIVWHATQQDLYQALRLATLLKQNTYLESSSFINWSTNELHIVVGPKMISDPVGQLGHMLEHYHRSDPYHLHPDWITWTASHIAVELALAAGR